MIRVLEPPRRRLAIVGSGVSGLVAAHRLHREWDLVVLEADDRVGGHVNTVEVELGGRRWAVDTGFIVFNELNYPGFTALLGELGVPSRESTMSFSVRCDRSGIEYNGTSLDRLFAQRRNLLRPSFIRMVRDILRFHREAREALAWPDREVTVADYAASRGYSHAFLERYLVPLGSALWSCPPGVFRGFPLRFVVEFLDHHRMLQVDGRPTWRTIVGGSQAYVRRLVAPFADRIRLATPVRSIRREADQVLVRTGRGAVETFDHVILACHADQALRLLDDPTPTEREVLAAFPYARNDAVLHTDQSVLPRTRRARAAWNYHRPASERAAATVTYDMNELQGLDAPERFLVTLNDDGGIDPAREIARFEYHHPVFTAARDAAQRRHAELADANRTSYCGAYWGYGFHEDGVQSALRVARALAGVPVA